MDMEPAFQQSTEEDGVEPPLLANVGEAPPQAIPTPSTLHLRDMLWFTMPTGAGVILYAWAIYKLIY